MAASRLEAAKAANAARQAARRKERSAQLAVEEAAAHASPNQRARSRGGGSRSARKAERRRKQAQEAQERRRKRKEAETESDEASSSAGSPAEAALRPQSRGKEVAQSHSSPVALDWGGERTEVPLPPSRLIPQKRQEPVPVSSSISRARSGGRRGVRAENAHLVTPKTRPGGPRRVPISQHDMQEEESPEHSSNGGTSSPLVTSEHVSKWTTVALTSPLAQRSDVRAVVAAAIVALVAGVSLSAYNTIGDVVGQASGGLMGSTRSVWAPVKTLPSVALELASGPVCDRHKDSFDSLSGKLSPQACRPCPEKATGCAHGKVATCMPPYVVTPKHQGCTLRPKHLQAADALGVEAQYTLR